MVRVTHEKWQQIPTRPTYEIDTIGDDIIDILLASVAKLKIKGAQSDFECASTSVELDFKKLISAHFST